MVLLSVNNLVVTTKPSYNYNYHKQFCPNSNLRVIKLILLLDWKVAQGQINGGENGIRTHGTFDSTQAFQVGAENKILLYNNIIILKMMKN